MVERRTIVFSDPRLADLEHPAFEARGERDGPHLALIGGIHGCEYSSIAAVVRFMNELDTAELAGSITAVPVVSMQSFGQRSPFVVPEDGKNLNRSFPGTYEGTYTDALARSIFDELIAPADALIDLHGGDLVEALEPFAIYDASRVEDRARALAVAFGLPYVVREDPADGLAGMTCSAAAQAGIPAIIAEAGGCGQLETVAVELLVAGTRNALRSLGMLPGPVDPPRADMRQVGAFDWLRCRAAGFWEASVRAGDEVAEGRLLGRVTSLHGDVQEEIHAPRDGVVLFLTTSAAVSDDGLLLGLGAELEPIG
jgi:predicted deacylase